MIVTDGLSKRYGTVEALRGLTLQVERGEVFGLLGPNGSGKTTTLRLILGLLRPTAGKALVEGLDCWRQSVQVRRRISYLPGELRLYGSQSGLGLLRYLSALRGGAGLDRAVAIAERVMKLDLNRRVRTYSTGMKQKLALAQAFADPVDILILDEPTSSLDPSARADVLGLVGQAKAQGQTVIFSGHVLSEVEQVADRVAIMRLGRLCHIEDMRQRRGLRMLLLRYPGSPPNDFPPELDLNVRERNGEVVLLEHRGSVDRLLGWLSAQPVVDLAIGTEDLRSLYDQFHGPNCVNDETEMATQQSGGA
jgi:ABC-2 type transport system ATP-binding protein